MLNQTVTLGASIMKVNTIAIDLAKNVFQVLGVNEYGKSVFNKRLNRQSLKEFMLNQPATRVVFEACYSAHYWGRTLETMGHTVQLIPAQHVTPLSEEVKMTRMMH